jgi:hypothetical protein
MPARTGGLQAHHLGLPGFTLDLEVRPYTLELRRSETVRAAAAYRACTYYMSGELAEPDSETVHLVLN